MASPRGPAGPCLAFSSVLTVMMAHHELAWGTAALRLFQALPTSNRRVDLTAAPSPPNPSPRRPGLRTRSFRRALRSPIPRPTCPPVPTTGNGSAIRSAAVCSGHSLGSDLGQCPENVPQRGAGGGSGYLQSETARSRHQAESVVVLSSD